MVLSWNKLYIIAFILFPACKKQTVTEYEKKEEYGFKVLDTKKTGKNKYYAWFIRAEHVDKYKILSVENLGTFLKDSSYEFTAHIKYLQINQRRFYVRKGDPATPLVYAVICSTDSAFYRNIETNTDLLTLGSDIVFNFAQSPSLFFILHQNPTPNAGKYPNFYDGYFK
jgi:ATP-dependent RNA circularization protein (DNA/RNA ligase family)